MDTTDANELFNEMQTLTGLTGLFSIIVQILSIFFVWILIKEMKWEAIFRFPRSVKARMFQVVLAISIGHLFAQFILQYWDYSSMLKSFAE
ncbi:DUF1146 domain-containing protein [Paenibacillus sp. L3-i20]|uniref:DUF1146 domain-containing protein n=1 Tax=Paenibacillus sp. L3-i20 TaxID=2905833 RepID=UPI001EDCE60C|nr:DUF1146 domain-containing protein [Paenibacillus sp. L3-i20]GKU76928.1 hypothetical protein L3i20_v213250 [Paenibacillus sp. L3-i20]